MAALPLLLPLIASAAVSAGKGVASALSPDAIANRKRIKELEDLQKQGAGLTDEQRTAMTRELVDPQRQLANETNEDYSKLAAGMGTSSGADLQALRANRDQQLAGGLNQAHTQILTADANQKKTNASELSSRQHAATRRTEDDFGALAGTGGEIASSLGEMKGQAPTTSTVASFDASQPISDFGALEKSLVSGDAGPAWEAADAAAFSQAAKKYGNRLDETIRAAQAGKDPGTLALLQKYGMLNAE